MKKEKELDFKYISFHNSMREVYRELSTADFIYNSRQRIKNNENNERNSHDYKFISYLVNSFIKRAQNNIERYFKEHDKDSLTYLHKELEDKQIIDKE